MSNLPRLIYNSVNIDFDRHFNILDYADAARRTSASALSGKTETLLFNRRNRIVVEKARINPTVEQQLAQFWLWADGGETFELYRDRDLESYWSFEKTLESNDLVDGTFTRATAANFVDPSTGLVTSAASGAVRYEAGKYGHGLLMERAGENILLRSEEFDNAAWTATNLIVNADTTETEDPEGGTTAEKCTVTSTSGTLRQDTSTNIGTDDAVFSVWLRVERSANVTNGDIDIIRADTGASIATQEIQITQQWQRFTIAHNNAGSIAANWGVIITLDTNTVVYYAWGAQLEVGKRYPTSYMQSVGTTGTRNADTLTYATSSILGDEMNTGSICFWLEPLYNSTNNEELHNLVTIDGLSGSFLEINYTAASAISADIYRKAGPVVGGNATVAAGSVPQDQAFHIALTWDLTVNDNIKLYLNGTLEDTSTSNNFAPLRVGTNINISDGTDSLDGIIDDLEIRRDVLTAGQVAARHSQSRALGWRRNYWSSLILDQDAYSPQLLAGTYRHDIELEFIEQK